MSVLCDWEIRELCEQRQMVWPFRAELLNPASIDVLLGDQLMVETPESRQMERLNISERTELDPYWLGPGQFVLAQTQETFRLPDNVSAMFALKSSRGREGFDHAQAGWCDPGWSGSVLTLELINARKYWPLALYPGLKIGQMVFSKMSATPALSYEVTGRYNNDAKVMGSWDEKTT